MKINDPNISLPNLENINFGEHPTTPCLWDKIEKDPLGRTMVMGLSCPCPKCSAWC